METGLLTTDQIRSWVIPLLEKYDMCSASLFGSLLAMKQMRPPTSTSCL